MIQRTRSIKLLSTLIPLLTLGSPTWATISNLDIAGGSRYVDDVSGSVPILFGGLAGPTGTGYSECKNGDTSGTTTGCNNCVPSDSSLQLGRLICNDSRIFDERIVSITFTSTKAGSAIITDDEGKNPLTLVSSVTASAGEEVTISTTWNQICNLDADAGGTGCDTLASDTVLTENFLVGIDGNSDNKLTDTNDDSTSITFRVYNPISTNTTSEDCADSSERGICSFSIGPGDKKVYLNDINVAENFPTVISGINVERVRIMYSSESFDGTSPTYNFVDISVVNTDQLDTDAVKGDLQNDVNYAFSYASVDSAGNVAHFMDDSLFTAACPGIATTTLLSTLTEAEIENCPYTGKPDEVIGLLKEDLNCFIATAAFGSPFHKYLNGLRLFRNKFLLNKKWGRKFVNIYYKIGPSYAKFIRNKPSLKAATRWALYPVVGFSYLSFTFGFYWAIGIYSFVFILLATMIFRLIVWRKGGALSPS